MQRERTKGATSASHLGPAMWRSLSVRIFAALVGVSFLSIAVSFFALAVENRQTGWKSTAERTLYVAAQAAGDLTRSTAGVIQGVEFRARFVGDLHLDKGIRLAVLRRVVDVGYDFAWLALVDGSGGVVVEGGKRISRDERTATLPVAVLGKETKILPATVAPDGR